jgi:hypothetical protein
VAGFARASADEHNCGMLGGSTVVPKTQAADSLSMITLSANSPA